jgi:hypothetical protein
MLRRAASVCDAAWSDANAPYGDNVTHRALKFSVNGLLDLMADSCKVYGHATTTGEANAG